MQLKPLALLICLLEGEAVFGFQNLFRWKAAAPAAAASSSSSAAVQRRKALEDRLLALIAGRGRRLANSDEISALIETLENQNPTPEPAISPLVYGQWRLLYTTNTDTGSPIQRRAVDAQKFEIYQDIIVNKQGMLQVNQVVKFSDSALLSVDALASTAAYPLPELTDRKSTGKILGLNILGVSLVGEEAKEDPNRPNSRIKFVFDEGNFDFGGKFKVPYPVPFRLPILRDTVKGWIDITYLSDRLRIARGNKGTTFILEKEARSAP